jgi:hypothetical protein
MLYGQRGRAPSKAITRMISKTVDNVIARPFRFPFLNVGAGGLVPPQFVACQEHDVNLNGNQQEIDAYIADI